MSEQEFELDEHGNIKASSLDEYDSALFAGSVVFLRLELARSKDAAKRRDFHSEQIVLSPVQAMDLVKRLVELAQAGMTGAQDSDSLN